MRAPCGVAAFLPYPYHGGLQEFAVRLASRLGTPVVAVGEPPEWALRLLEASGVEVVVYPEDLRVLRAPLLLSPRRLRGLRRILSGFDLVHAHGPYPATGELALRGLRYVYTYHFDVEMVGALKAPLARAYEALLLKPALRRALAVTASSREFMGESRVLRALPRGLLRLLRLGVDVEELRPSWRYDSYLAFVGRVIPEKGVHVLIEALAVLRERGVRLDLEVVGEVVDAAYAERLERLARRLGVWGSVRLHGFLPRGEMTRILSRAVAAVLPSLTRLESFGIALLEAAALARPLVASRAIPGARELIRGSRAGFLAEPGDPRGLAGAVEAILEAGPEELGRRARRYVEERHDWRVVAGEAARLYRETGACGGGPG